jgi:predicted dinucleotide-binding enzyme
MTTVSIIGTGNMANAIDGVLTKGGAEVELIGHAEVGSAPLTSEIVILAVPYPAIDQIIETYRDQLAGTVLVDISNPLDFETFESLVVPADSSAAAQIQEKVPEARVLKAFNTTFASTLATGKVGENLTTVLVAGDDADARAALTGVITAAGYGAIDAGPLARARELEAIGFLQLTLAASEKISWGGGFGLVR